MAYNHDERVFFAQLNCPRYIEDKNNNRFDVVDRLEFIRNKIRNCEIQIDDYIKEKENLGRYCHHHDDNDDNDDDDDDDDF